MTFVTICPKELVSASPIANADIEDFESKMIAPLIELIDECEVLNVPIRLSREMLDEILLQAPWSECLAPQKRSYLDDWFVGVISRLDKYADIHTVGTLAKHQCINLSINVNAHFKELVAQYTPTNPQALAREAFGIQVASNCPNNIDCGKHTYVKSAADIMSVRFPWRKMYPADIPAMGEIPFSPADGWEAGIPKRASDNGYLDSQGRSWKWDHLHNNQWDVQLGDRQGSYLNVNEKGQLLSAGSRTGKRKKSKAPTK